MSEIRSILARMDREEIGAEEASELLQELKRSQASWFDRFLFWLVG